MIAKKGHKLKERHLRGWAKIHSGGTKGPLSMALAPFSAIYGKGISFRLWAYRSGIFKRRTLPGFVLSVGNITTGGTGKTPAVAMLAQWAVKKGFRPAVLSRGYKGKYKKNVLEVSDGRQVLSRPTETGDEPYLLAMNLPGIPVIVSKKRFLAGMLAYKKHNSNFFILDDGFQHLELERDMDLVLVDSENPFGNTKLLPRGPLREPIRNLARAHAVIFTRSKALKPLEDTQWFFREAFTTEKSYYGGHFPERVVFPLKNSEHEPSFLKGKKIAAFTGIARPHVFEQTLKELGAEVLFFRAFRDHHPFTEAEITTMDRIRKEINAEYLVTTEKDWVRVSSLPVSLADIAYLTIKFALLSRQDELLTFIKQRADLKLGRK